MEAIDWREFDPAVHSLAPLKPLTVDGQEFMPEPDVRLPDLPIAKAQQLVRVKLAKVMPGGAAVTATVAPPKNPFECEVCHRTFKAKANLGAHRRVHKKKA